MKLLVMVNPLAGGGRTLSVVPRLKTVFERSGHCCQWRITGSVADIQSLIVAASKSGIDGVLIAGGDGTISYALPALLKTDLPVGIIPCGRGNDFARNLGLPLDIAEAACFPRQPVTRMVDIATVNEKPFASVACVGFDARVNELANKPHRIFKGRSVFVYSVLKALKSFEPFAIDVSIDNDRWKGAIMMAAIANGGCYGGGMRIAPEADLEDGLLNICIVRKTSKWTFLKNFPRVFRGQHINHPDVLMLTGRKIEITSVSRQAVFADGERISHLPLICAVGKHHLKILYPRIQTPKGGEHAQRSRQARR